MASQCNKPYTSKDKWIVALLAALLFLFFASPFMFRTLNAVTQSFGLVISSATGCPNMAGLLIVALLFMGVTRLLMR